MKRGRQNISLVCHTRRMLTSANPPYQWSESESSVPASLISRVSRSPVCQLALSEDHLLCFLLPSPKHHLPCIISHALQANRQVSMNSCANSKLEFYGCIWEVFKYCGICSVDVISVFCMKRFNLLFSVNECIFCVYNDVFTLSIFEESQNHPFF